MVEYLTSEEIAALDDAVSTIEYYLSGDIEDLRVLCEDQTVHGMQKIIETLRQAAAQSWKGVDWDDVAEAFYAGAHYCREDFVSVEKRISNNETGDERRALQGAQNSVSKALVLINRICGQSPKVSPLSDNGRNHF